MNKATLLVLFCYLFCVQGYYLPLTLSQCSASGTCTPSSTGLVIDSVAASGASQQSFSSAGLTSDGTTLTMTGQRRLYLVNAAQNSYQLFNLRNKEFTFDVNTNNIVCGGNGALYFTAMSNSGTNYANGAGYCDAQNGCNEMDLWEANRFATALSSHSCNGGCDTSGCQYNPYRAGQQSYFGPGSSYTVDSSQKITVVTQFITNDNTDTGTLVQINRFYRQGTKTITGYSLTPTYCNQWWSSIGVSDGKGGLTTIGNVANWVLVFSFWSSNGGMTWLDSPPSGPCSTENFSSGSVTFGNLKFGPIGSTTGGTSAATLAASSAVASTSARTTTSTTRSLSTSTTTTTGSASTTGSGASLVVYTDSLLNGFQDWSWSPASAHSLTATCPSPKGLSISFIVQNYEAIYFHRATNFVLGTYSSLNFQIYADVSSSIPASACAALLYDSSATSIGKSPTLPSAIPPRAWTSVSIPISSFEIALTTQISGVAIQAKVSAALGTVYIDNLSFN